MASGGKDTHEYKSVLSRLTCITEYLKVNQPAKDSLTQKFQQHEWLDIVAKPTEEQLVKLALIRIENDVNQFAEFTTMLKQTAGMDLIVDKLKVGPAVSEVSPEHTPADETTATKIAAAKHCGIVQLRKSFKSLKSAVQKGVEKSKEGVTHLVEEIMYLPAPLRDECDEEFLNKHTDDIYASKSIPAVFSRIGFHWDYLNPDVYEHLIETYNLEDLHGMMKDYRIKLDQFIECMSLQDFCKVEGRKCISTPPPGFEAHVTKHDWDPTTPLKKVIDFREECTNEYCLRKCAVWLVGMGKGCVCITLLVPEGIKIETTREEFYEKHSIIHLNLNGVCMYSKEGRDTEEEDMSNITTLCGAAIGLDVHSSTPEQPPSSLPVEPPSAPVEPPSAPVEPPSAPVEPPSAPVEPPSAPVEPPSAPVEPPSAPVEPPSAPVEPPSAPVEPPSAPLEPQVPTSPWPTGGGLGDEAAFLCSDRVQEYDFVTEPEEDFFCPVTYDLLLQPQKSDCCGAIFSSRAVAVIQGNQCPLCNKENFTAQPDKCTRYRVYLLQVFCRYKERGCGWTGELISLERHIQSCPRKNTVSMHFTCYPEPPAVELAAAEVSSASSASAPSFAMATGGPGRVQNIKSDADFQRELIAAGGQLVVAEFFTTWCPPSRMVAPAFDRLSAKYPSAVFLKLDAEICQSSAIRHGVEGVPAFRLFQNQEEIQPVRGIGEEGSLEAAIIHHLDPQSETAESEQPTTPTITVPGQMNLYSLIDLNDSECLNESDNHPFKHCLKPNSQYLESDCDKQLIIVLAFTQNVKLHTLQFVAPPDGRAPKTVKLFVNQPQTLDFETAEQRKPTQEFVLTEEDVQEDSRISLDFVKHRSVRNLTVFVQDNQGGEDTTVLQYLGLFGNPLDIVNIGDFSKLRLT